MKTVASFEKPEEAHLLRSHLEGSGIAAYVRDEHTVAVDWRLSGAIGGVKVEVADEDLQAALSLIRTVEPRQSHDSVTEKKKRKKFSRYMKVFGVLFVVTFAFLAWWWKVGNAAGLGASFFCSFILAGCIAVFCSLFES